MTPVDDRLAAYAIGALDPEEHEAFEKDLEKDPSLRTALDEFMQINEKLAEAAPAAQPSTGLRDRLLASIRPDTRFDGFVDRVSQFLDLNAQRVRELFADVDNDEAWEAGPFAAVTLMHFAGGPRVASADCGLVRIQTGTTFPHHSHDGDEWTFVLQGRILEAGGREFGPGDVSYRAKGSQHSVTATGDVDAVFVVVLHDGLTVCRPPE